MQPGERRRARSNGGVVAARSSVWETRMKMDEIRGGIKVFNGDDDSNEDVEGIKLYGRLRRNQSDGVDNVVKKKRRNWKPPEPVSIGVFDKNPIQLRKAKSVSSDVKDGILKEEEEEEEEEDEIVTEGEMRNFDDKEIDLPVEKSSNVEEERKIEQINEVPILMDVEKKQNLVKDLNQKDPKEEKKIHQINEIPTLPGIEKNKNCLIDLKKKEIVEVEEEMIDGGTGTPKRMQHIVDLVMWRDISKSAFVFGFGTFILLSSSYAKDLNFSLISTISYLGLVYLALNFIYKSVIKRGDVEFDGREGRCIIGEEEAICALRFLLPYINEVLMKFRALFSGDPAMTMKVWAFAALAVLLFVMARCGSSITIWTLAKLAFFGMFTIPKVLSTYSLQLARHGKFWLERFRDGWESCTRKKAVAAAVFTLIWNMSSVVAKIWAVFMLVVAVQFYQQCAVDFNAEEEEEAVVEPAGQENSEPGSCPGNDGNNNGNAKLQMHHRQRNGPPPAGRPCGPGNGASGTIIGRVRGFESHANLPGGRLI